MKSRIYKNLFLLFIAYAVLMLAHCKKTSQQKDEPVARESPEMEVSLPEMQWEKTLKIEIETSSDNQNSEILTQIVEENLVDAIQPGQTVQIINREEKEQIDPDYFIKGQIDWQNEKIHARFQLIGTQNDTSLWEKSYDENIESVLMVSENAAADVRMKLTGDSAVQDFKHNNIGKATFSKYLAGKAALARQTRQDNGQAIQYFKSAFREDTTFTLALTGLAESYLQIHQQGWERGIVWIRLAQEASERAIQIDSRLANGYIQLGNALLAWGDFHQAEKQFRKALNLNINLPEAWIGLGFVFSHFGLYEPCLVSYDRALSLKSNMEISLSRVMILIGMQDYKQAETSLAQLTKDHPNEKYLFSFLALIYLYEENLLSAEKSIRQGLTSEKFRPFSHAIQAMILAKQKKFDEALYELETEVKPHAGGDPSLSTAVAAIYSLIGQKGMAVQWLEKAITLGYQEYPWLAHDPNFSNLEEDRRFQNLIAGLKIKWAARRQTYRHP